MSAIGLLIVGAVLVILSYYLPAEPPPVKMIVSAAGWICIVVGVILLVAYLLGLPIALGAH
jgi:hypothetical protein